MKDNAYTILSLVLLFAIIGLALFTYTLKIVGIAPAYDDSSYTYSLLNPLTLKTTALFGGSIGFFIYGYPFLHILGHIMIVPTLMTLSAIVFTLIFLFLIGLEYKNKLGGLLGAFLYAFNPIVFAYSNRLLPDIFTTMFLALAILLFLKATKKEKQFLSLASGLALGFGIFFGYQVSFAALGYFIFAALYLIYEKKGQKGNYFVLAFAGVAIMFFLWMLYQHYLYNSLFFLVTFSSKIYSITEQFAWSADYYPIMIFPMHIVPKIIEGSWEPNVNVGLLGYILLFSSMFLFARYGNKYRKRIIPYLAASIAIVLFLMYGTQSFITYAHVYDENRFLMPFVLMSAITSAMAISMLDRKILHVLIPIIIVAYLKFLALSMPSILSLYDSQDALLNYLQSTLPYQSMSSYKIYQNIYSMSDAFCYLFNASHQNCQDNSLVTIPANICAQNKTAIFSLQEICNGSITFGSPPVYIHIRD